MIRFIEHKDEKFTTRKPQPDWLGIKVPIVRAEVGGTVIVHFLNRTRGYYGMHPHGFQYDNDNEKAQYNPAGAGAKVPPGGSFTYTWFADEASGSGPMDSSSVLWMYHLHADEPSDINLGLIGPIIITAKGKAKRDATPKDMDREFVTLFMIFNEDNDQEQGLMHSIDGYIFGNLPGLVMNNEEKVRWYVMGMGNEVDVHTPHWRGRTVLYNMMRTAVLHLLPGAWPWPT
jgi:multicopper oxidase